MKMIFFEVQEWEKEWLQFAFQDALLVEAKLTAENVNTETFKDAEIISVFINSAITEEVLAQLPKLKYIATRSTGYDHIDIAACKKRGVAVSNVPEYGSHTVAEYTFALLLMVTRKMYEAVSQLKECNFDHNSLKGIDLFGKTLGIVGLGKIGVEVLKIAQGFGMKVLVTAHSQKPELQQQYNFSYVPLEDLIRQSDIITLHLPATADTHHIINTENILKFKEGSILINTSRGPLVQTEAILLGIEKGILFGVGLDVLEEEKNLTEELQLLSVHNTTMADFKTICMDHVLIQHPHVIVTPHNAFNSTEALMRITNTTIENIQHFEEGNATNLVEVS